MIFDEIPMELVLLFEITGPIVDTIWKKIGNDLSNEIPRT